MDVCLALGTMPNTFPSYNAGTTRAVIREPGGDEVSYRRKDFVRQDAVEGKPAVPMDYSVLCERCLTNPRPAYPVTPGPAPTSAATWLLPLCLPCWHLLCGWTEGTAPDYKWEVILPPRKDNSGQFRKRDAMPLEEPT